MAYYQAGDYYRGGGYYRAGSLGSFLGGALRVVGGLGVPGVSTIANVASGLLSPAQPVTQPRVLPESSTPVTLAAGPGQQLPTAKQRAQGVTKVGVSPSGTIGVAFRKHRSMNAGNAKAARRAIRRITSVRKMLKSIERQLPMRSAPRSHGSRGVITRSEAARALRA